MGTSTPSQTFGERAVAALADEHIDPAELRTLLPLSTAVMLAYVLIVRRGEVPSVRKIQRLTGHSFRDLSPILRILREP
jgi:hypothetical protein